MSSSEPTPYGRLSEAALAGILSSSDLPESAPHHRTPSEYPSSTDIPTSYMTPLFRPSKSRFLNSLGDFSKAHSTPSLQSTPITEKIGHKPCSSSGSRPNYSTPYHSDKHEVSRSSDCHSSTVISSSGKAPVASERSFGWNSNTCTPGSSSTKAAATSDRSSGWYYNTPGSSRNDKSSDTFVLSSRKAPTTSERSGWHSNTPGSSSTKAAATSDRSSGWHSNTPGRIDRSSDTLVLSSRKAPASERSGWIHSNTPGSSSSKAAVTSDRSSGWHSNTPGSSRNDRSSDTLVSSNRKALTIRNRPSSLPPEARTSSTTSSSDRTQTKSSSTVMNHCGTGSNQNYTLVQSNNNNENFQSCEADTNMETNAGKSTRTANNVTTSGPNVRGFDVAICDGRFDLKSIFNSGKYNFNLSIQRKNSGISQIMDYMPGVTGGYQRCKPNQSSGWTSLQNPGQSIGLGNRYPTGAAYSSDQAQRTNHSSLPIPSLQAKRPRLEQTLANENDSDEDGIEEAETQIYLSLMWSHGHLGMAYYDLNTQDVYLMPDAKEDENFQLTKQVLEQVHPHCVIVSASQDIGFLDVLKAYASRNESTGSDDVHQFIQLLPTLEFSYESSKRRALMLSLPGMSEDCTEMERSIYISSLVPMDKVNLMRAFGGLLKYLDKVRVGIQLEEADATVPIMAIHTFSLENTMVLDDISYTALDIFKKSENPATRIAGWSNESKYSLFGILNKCRSVNGAKLLRLWFLRPTRDLHVLEERHSAIGFFKRSANMETVSKLRACIAGVRTVSRILPQMKKNRVSLKNWKILYKTIYNCILVGDICSQISPKLPVFHKISRINQTESLQKVAHHINKIADFEEFAKTGMFSVKPGVDEELDQMKRTYNGLPDFMTLVAKKELEQLSDDIQQCNVTYLPQLGYLLVIPVTEQMVSEDNYEQPNLDLKFVSNGQAFYKNSATSELDQQLGDTESLIQDRQTSIMHQLQDIIISHSCDLLCMIDCLAELDCLMGLAMVARDNNYVCPQLTSDNVLHVKAGRHPIQEHLCSPFVPNDLESGGGGSRMKLLTGPNASGKSVYLKQVALIVFMAHIGSYVPAKSATIGLVDRLFTCLKTRESLSTGMSSFMMDLNMVSSAVNCYKPNSLVLLDEFGKGTDTVSGMSLLIAMMKEWLEKEEDCPHVLVSTHFHSISHEKRLPDTPLLQCQMMDTVRSGDGELVFLYQLVSGCATCSHACHVAAQAGLPQEIIGRGQEVTELLRKEKVVGRVDTASTVTQYKRCQRLVRKFLDLDLDTCDVEAFIQDFVRSVPKEH